MKNICSRCDRHITDNWEENMCNGDITVDISCQSTSVLWKKDEEKIKFNHPALANKDYQKIKLSWGKDKPFKLCWYCQRDFIGTIGDFLKTKVPSQFNILVIFIFATVFLSSCADVQPNIKPYLEGHTYGFWGGLWHGIVAPLAWIGSLFSDDIDVWAVNNNGGWYTFGFILGIGALTGGSSKATS